MRFLLDMLFQALALVAVGIVFGLADAGGEVLRPIVTIFAFLVVNFYFAFFQTPAKRRLGIRVIDADLQRAGLDTSLAPTSLPDQFIVVGIRR